MNVRQLKVKRRTERRKSGAKHARESTRRAREGVGRAVDECGFTCCVRDGDGVRREFGRGRGGEGGERLLHISRKACECGGWESERRCLLRRLEPVLMEPSTCVACGWCRRVGVSNFHQSPPACASLS